jgi:hypothetical protein
MAKVIIYVRGGVVQGLLADCKDVEAMIVDYDNEECEKHLGAPQRSFEPVECDLLYFAETVAGTE